MKPYRGLLIIFFICAFVLGIFYVLYLIGEAKEKDSPGTCPIRDYAKEFSDGRP